MNKKFLLVAIASMILTYSIFLNSSILSYAQENNTGQENKTVYNKQQNLNIYLLSKVFEKEIEKIPI